MYTPVPHGVLATSVRLGWNHPFGGTTSLPPTERYFAGGSTTLRGFSFDDAVPEGGYAMTIGNFEYRTPLGIIPIKGRSEEHTSELQSHSDLVCRLLLE